MPLAFVLPNRPIIAYFQWWCLAWKPRAPVLGSLLTRRVERTNCYPYWARSLKDSDSLTRASVMSTPDSLAQARVNIAAGLDGGSVSRPTGSVHIVSSIGRWLKSCCPHCPDFGWPQDPGTAGAGSKCDPCLANRLLWFEAALRRFTNLFVLRQFYELS